MRTGNRTASYRNNITTSIFRQNHGNYRVTVDYEHMKSLIELTD